METIDSTIGVLDEPFGQPEEHHLSDLFDYKLNERVKVGAGRWKHAIVVALISPPGEESDVVRVRHVSDGQEAEYTLDQVRKVPGGEPPPPPRRKPASDKPKWLKGDALPNFAKLPVGSRIAFDHAESEYVKTPTSSGLEWRSVDNFHTPDPRLTLGNAYTDSKHLQAHAKKVMLLPPLEEFQTVMYYPSHADDDKDGLITCAQCGRSEEDGGFFRSINPEGKKWTEDREFRCIDCLGIEVEVHGPCSVCGKKSTWWGEFHWYTPDLLNYAGSYGHQMRHQDPEDPPDEGEGVFACIACHCAAQSEEWAQEREEKEAADAAARAEEERQALLGQQSMFDDVPANLKRRRR